jgi:hypothetical protein
MKPFSILSWLWAKKSKFFLLTALVTLFTLLFFPLEDLRELVTIKVYEQSGRKIFVLFNTVNLGLIPPHISVGELKVSSPQLGSNISAQKVTLIPFSDLFLKQTPAGEVQIEGLWSGIIKASIKPGRLLENNVRSQKVSFLTEKINLKTLSETVKLPIRILGSANATATGEIDPSLVTQPDLDFEVTVKGFELPPSQVETMMGPLILPHMKLGDAKIKGRWAGGKIQIESLQFGKLDDDIVGTGMGYLMLNIQNQGGQIVPEMGGYQLELDILIKKSLESQLGLFISLIEAYKTQTPDGARFRFRLSGNNLYTPPNFGPFK